MGNKGCYVMKNDFFLLQTVLGKRISRPAVVDQGLVERLLDCAQNTDKFQTVRGTTLCADDFYEGTI